MGLLKRLWKDKYLTVFIVLLMAYFLFMNYKIDYVLGYDEARHAVQGHFFYDYFRTLLSGEFVSVRTFLQEYMQRGYNIGWPVLIDPPAHGIAQGLLFMLVGASGYTARLATMLLVIAGAFLFYFLSIKVLKSKALAITAVFLYLLYPYVFQYARESILMVPISFLMVGWFYFFFYKEDRYFSLILTKGVRLRLNITLLVSALFLTAATLMKYQNLVFASVFVGLYSILLTVEHWRTEKNILSSLVKSGAWKLIRRHVFVVIVFLLIGGWWLKFSLFDSKMFNRVFFEGLGRERYGIFYYFTETAKTTYYAVFFAFVPILTMLLEKKKSVAERKWQIFLFTLSVYLIATLLISNQKIRYMIAAIPFLYILIVMGMYQAAQFLSSKVRIKAAYIFGAMILVFSVLYVVEDLKVIDERMYRYGRENSELTDYIRSIPDPKLLVYPKGGFEKTVNYYATPDLFAFRAMTARDEHNPKNMNHLVDIKFWDGGIENNPEPYFKWLNTTSDQVPTAVVVFRFEPNSTLLSTMEKRLPLMGFTSHNLTYYTVFEKSMRQLG